MNDVMSNEEKLAFMGRLNVCLVQSSGIQGYNIGDMRGDAKSTRRGNIPLKVFPGTTENVPLRQLIDSEVHGVLRDFTGQFAKLLDKTALPENIQQSLKKIEAVRDTYAKAGRAVEKIYTQLYPDKETMPIYNGMENLAIFVTEKIIPDSMERVGFRPKRGDQDDNRKEYYTGAVSALAVLLEQEKEPVDLWNQRKTVHDSLSAIVQGETDIKTALNDFELLSKGVETIQFGGAEYKNINRNEPRCYPESIDLTSYCFYAEAGASALLDSVQSPRLLEAYIRRQLGYQGQQTIITTLIRNIQLVKMPGTELPLHDNPQLQGLLGDAVGKTEIALTCCGKRPKTAAAAAELLQRESERVGKSPEEQGPSHWAEYDDLIQAGCKRYLTLVGINDKETFDNIAAKHRMTVIGKWLSKTKQADVTAKAVDNSGDISKGKCPFGFDAKPQPVKCPFGYGA